MAQRLTVRKAFPDWDEFRRQKARDAITKYNEMLEKAQHAASDLTVAMDALLDNICNNNPDIDDTDIMKVELANARESLQTIIRLTKYEISQEEMKL